MPAGGGKDTVAEDMAAFGFKDFQPPDWMVEEDTHAEQFGVLPENWEAVSVFLACATQWSVGHEGAYTGLRYESVRVVMRLHRVRDAADVFGRVQRMESAALREFAAMRK